MKPMTSAPVEPADLLDLKLLPAWVKEPVEAKSYEHYEGEEEQRELHRPWDRKGKRPTPNSDKSRAGAQRPTFKGRRTASHQFRKTGPDSERGVREQHRRTRRPHDRTENRHHENRQKLPQPLAPPITIRFLPYSTAFENVVAQIKSSSVAYSLYALARLFLEKPERYEVRLIGKAEARLYRLGDNGALSLNREFLGRSAF